jgi:hypothetical protein
MSANDQNRTFWRKFKLAHCSLKLMPITGPPALITIEFGGATSPRLFSEVQEYAYAGASGLLWMAPGVLLDWRHCGVDLVVILHHEIDIGREFHGLRGRFQF